MRPAAATDAESYIRGILETISEGKSLLVLGKGQEIYSQGEDADAIFVIQSGKVKIGRTSREGKEAVIAMRGPGDFLGEGALVGAAVRTSTATVLESSLIFRIEKLAMTRALVHEPDLSEKFIAALLVRNIDLEEDLCDQHFYDSEKRLARVLLKLSRLGDHDGAANSRMFTLSHETLAEMVGTTRARITVFMNRLQAMGVIDYCKGKFTINTELLTDKILDN